jgi:hypothetical protein
MQPQLYVLSKADLVTEKEIDDIVEWTIDPKMFDLALLSMKDQNISLITRELANALFASGLLSEPIVVSAKNNSGLVELNAQVTRILTGGDEPTT